MFKLLKYLSVSMAAIILILLALPFFIDVNNYKDEIKQAMYDATGRNLDIAHIKLSTFPWVGITLHDVQLQNTLGFTQPLMMSIKSIDIQLELIPLLSKKIEIKRFELDSPTLWLEKHLDGANNWTDTQQAPTVSDVTTPSPSKTNTAHRDMPQSKPHTSQPDIALNAELLQLIHGTIIFSDEGKEDIILSDIQLDIHDLQLINPIKINFSAKSRNDPFNIHATVGPLHSFKHLDISQLPISIQIQSQKLSLQPLAPWLSELDQEHIKQFGTLDAAQISMDISIEQRADHMLLSSGDLQLHMNETLSAAWQANIKSLHTLNIEALSMRLKDKELFTLSGKIKHLQKNPSYEIRLETTALQRVWLNQFSPQLKDMYRLHVSPWKSIKLGALIAGDKSVLELRDFQLKLDDDPIQVSGNLVLGDAPDIQLRISANQLNLDPWIPSNNPSTTQALPDVSPEHVGPSIEPIFQPEDNSKVNLEPDLTFLKPWYVSIQLNSQKVQVNQLELDNLHLTLSAEKGVIRLNPLKFEVAGGQVVENFTLYANRYPATWKESIKIGGVSVQPILKSVAGFDKLSGIAQLSTDLSGKGLLPSTITKNLSGNGHFVFQDGQFKGIDITKAVRKLNKEETSTQNHTNFAQAQGSFRIRKGVLSNHDLYMASPLFRLTGKGKVYLDSLTVDYNVRPRLISSLTGQGGTQSQKGLVVPMHISGPFDDLDMDITFDKQSLLESAAAINAATNNKIGGVAGKILDQGFVQTREAQKKAAAEKAKDKLKNALKRLNF